MPIAAAAQCAACQSSGVVHLQQGSAQVPSIQQLPHTHTCTHAAASSAGPGPNTRPSVPPRHNSRLAVPQSARMRQQLVNGRLLAGRVGCSTPHTRAPTPWQSKVSWVDIAGDRVGDVEPALRLQLVRRHRQQQVGVLGDGHAQRGAHGRPHQLVAGGAVGVLVVWAAAAEAAGDQQRGERHRGGSRAAAASARWQWWPCTAPIRHRRPFLLPQRCTGPDSPRRACPQRSRCKRPRHSRGLDRRAVRASGGWLSPSQTGTGPGLHSPCHMSGAAAAVPGRLPASAARSKPCPELQSGTGTGRRRSSSGSVCEKGSPASSRAAPFANGKNVLKEEKHGRTMQSQATARLARHGRRTAAIRVCPAHAQPVLCCAPLLV